MTTPINKVKIKSLKKRNEPPLFRSTQKPIVALTKGWQCCKCKEEMYRDEDSCNWCKHNRCGTCRSFQV